MNPHTSLIVCATPRTGSGLLCDALWNTGLAGRPDEYFGPNTEKRYSKHWGTSTYGKYFNKVIEEGTTPNGVFSAKLHWTHMDNIKNKSSEISKFASIECTDFLKNLFPNPRYVWIKRRDIVRQAISRFIAQQTGISKQRGSKSPKPKRSVKFDFVSISNLVNNINYWNEHWITYFEAHEISPLTLFYEDDLEHGYEETVKRILVFLGVNIPEDLIIQTDYRKQSDELSEKFVQLYHSTAK